MCRAAHYYMVGSVTRRRRRVRVRVPIRTSVAAAAAAARLLHYILLRELLHYERAVYFSFFFSLPQAAIVVTVHTRRRDGRGPHGALCRVTTRNITAAASSPSLSPSPDSPRPPTKIISRPAARGIKYY